MKNKFAVTFLVLWTEMSLCCSWPSDPAAGLVLFLFSTKIAFFPTKAVKK